MQTMLRSVEDEILTVFDEFSHKYHWSDETSKNIHYYNGWKTNKAWKINNKVIIRLNGFDDWSGKFRPRYEVERKLEDIEKVFNYLDSGKTMGDDTIQNILRNAESTNQSRKIDTKYFYITFFKKGTCHLEFKDLELLDKFNIFGSQRKGWLPPTYGKKHYKDMTQEEKTVVNEFQGEEAYNKVMKNKDYYIPSSVGLVLLNAAS
jgi:hypothetical protein